MTSYHMGKIYKQDTTIQQLNKFHSNQHLHYLLPFFLLFPKKFRKKWYQLVSTGVIWCQMVSNILWKYVPINLCWFDLILVHKTLKRVKSLIMPRGQIISVLVSFTVPFGWARFSALFPLPLLFSNMT